MRLALAAMLLLGACSDTGVDGFIAGLFESTARSACRSADNCEDLCANGAAVETSRAICVPAH